MCGGWLVSRRSKRFQFRILGVPIFATGLKGAGNRTGPGKPQTRENGLHSFVMDFSDFFKYYAFKLHMCSNGNFFILVSRVESSVRIFGMVSA